MHVGGDEQEMQQFSPHPENAGRKLPTNKKAALNEFLGAPMNYLKLKDFCVELGLLTELAALTNNSSERALLFDMWKMLGGQVAEHIYVENLRTLVQIINRIVDPKRVFADVKAPQNQTASGENDT